VIRSAKNSDIPAILEIERALFSDPWEEQLFNEAIKDHKDFFVSIEQNKITGYIIFEKVLDEGHITNLAVSKEYQRKGLASELINKILDLARQQKIKQVFLEVRESNEAARKLYLKFGFLEIGKRKAYYNKTNENAIILKLDL
jgi:ribosomal-protein-alanine N-acetyltransferase